MSALALSPAAPAILTEHGARAITAQLVGVLDDLTELLDRARRGRVWVPLRYPSWEAYCAAELAGHLPRLSVDERRATVTELYARGHSKRAIAAGLDVADQTVRADLRAVDAHEQAPVDEQVVPKTSRAAMALLEAGERGLTVHELTAKAKRGRWPGAVHHGAISAVLVALQDQGRSVRTSTYRQGAAVHLHPTYA